MTGRPNRGQIAFMTVWLTVWTAAILVVLWMVGAALLAGDYGAAPFLLIWLALAAFGLYAGIRRMQTLLGLARPPAAPPPRAQTIWTDDLPGPRDG